MKHLLNGIIFGVLLAVSADARRQKVLNDATYPGQPRVICEECVPRERILAPGVGFDLASSYATVAIRYQNRTVVDVGRIEGLEEYNELIARLGPPYVQYGYEYCSPSRFCLIIHRPPFDNVLDRLRWDLDQASRKWRKLRGLPSTTDIETFSNFLTRLENFASRSLMFPASRVAISLPDLPNLLREDWAEIVELSGLEALKSYKNWGQPLNDLNAAWAGMGYGLCEHWRDIDACEEEEELIVPRYALALSFTGDELSVHKTWVSNAHYTYSLVSANYRDLGYESWRSNPANSTFWDSLGKAVADVATSEPQYAIQDLIIMGEYAEEKSFLDAIWKALGDVTDVQKLWQPLQVSGFSAEFVAARGAAELAKRWQGETWDCVEEDWCEDRGAEGGIGKEEI
ncbi:hypothetical protein BKA64DRAFT_397085 [Cadophora sp. MPI-SDFR-AT-0126]|nr:hypothetical protein BKA64DRAFT_397085 [Leotiomycetes sp. MPI-SDFR-AT-0126]